VTAYLLDTHYWIWLQLGDASQIKSDARDELLAIQRKRTLFLSAISILEIARLSSDGLLDLSMSVDQFVEVAIRSGGLQLLPLTTRILIESMRLPGTIHRDPADRLLVATAREHGLTLVTRDKALNKYAEQGHLNAYKL
jgi:PIN domain nuclease of toxin-antitoxin system